MKSDQPGLIAFCGLMAAGKSTLARKLAKQHQASDEGGQHRPVVLLSEDELLHTLYPDEIRDVDGYAQRARRLKSALQPIIVQLLHSGQCVILDFPGNTVAQRQWFRGLIDTTGVEHELHHLCVDEERCLQQLARRAQTQPERAQTDTPEVFALMKTYFEPPGDAEGFNVVVHTQALTTHQIK